MKKLLAMMLALLMVMSLAACGGNSGNDEIVTTEPTESIPETNMNYFSLSMGEDFENIISLTAYPNEDGTVYVEYNGTIRKVGNLSAEAMGRIAQAFEATALPSLNGQDDYQEGEASASMYVSYAGEEGDESVMVSYSGVIPEVFTTGFNTMDALFQTLTADIPEYVPQPVVSGEIAEGDKAALDAILANMTLEVPDAFMISGVAKDEYMGDVLGLSSTDNIVSAVSFAPMMMSSAYSLNIVTVNDAANIEAVAQDFVSNIDWLKWVCVQPSHALVAVKGNQVLCLLAADEINTMTVSAIEAAGWTTHTSLENPNM